MGHQQRQRLPHPLAGLMPLEQFADLGPAQAFGGGAEGAQDVVGNGIAEGVAEDILGRRIHILPEGKGGRQVFMADLLRAVQQGIEEGQAHGLRFGA